MPQLPPDLSQLIEHYVATGQYETEEDVLRDALRALAEERGVLDDIRQGLDDLDAGLGRPLEAVDEDLRKKYSIPHDA